MFGFRRHIPSQTLDLQRANRTRSQKRGGRKVGALLFLTIILIGAVLAYWLINGQPKKFSPIPAKYRTALHFPLYYPDPKKLPDGYILDTSSFTSPAHDVLLYAVKYGSEKLVFSLQQKPSDSEVKTFESQRIPVHIEYKTNVGTAELGAIGKQSVVSLPTDKQTWIIITGPERIDQAKLVIVMNSLVSKD